MTSKALIALILVLIVALQTSKTSAGEIDDLHARIQKEYPQLLDRALDDFQRVTLIRQWAWSHTPIAASSANLLENDPAIHWPELDAAQTFKLFNRDRGGVFCGGAATGLQRLYESFGYQAWTINSGDPVGTATHVVTAVKIQHQQRTIRCLQDAYFNVSYVDSKAGDPLDYLDLLDRLARGQHESIRTLESDYRTIRERPVTLIAAKDIAGRSPRDLAIACWTVREDDFSAATLGDATLKLTSARCMDKFLDRLCHTPDGKPAWFLDWLVRQGHPADIRYLYLYPLGVSGPDNDALLAQARLAATRKPKNRSSSPR